MKINLGGCCTWVLHVGGWCDRLPVPQADWGAGWQVGGLALAGRTSDMDVTIYCRRGRIPRRLWAAVGAAQRARGGAPRVGQPLHGALPPLLPPLLLLLLQLALVPPLVPPLSPPLLLPPRCRRAAAAAAAICTTTHQ